MSEAFSFRPMRRSRQQLSRDDCVRQLMTEPRGVLAVLGDGGYPYTIPLDFYYENDRLYFHCAKEGHKIDAVLRCDKASFCVLDQGDYDEGDNVPHFKSVVVFGHISPIKDQKIAIGFARKLGCKYLPAEDVEEELTMKASSMTVLEMKIDHMSGKLVYEI